MNYYKMSTLELQDGDSVEHSYRKALSFINRALEHDVKPQYLAHKGTLLFLLGKEKDSLQCFKQALRFSLSDRMKSEVLNNYACVLAKLGKKDKALTFFNKLEQDKAYLTPEVALVNQAKIYYDLAQYRQAKEKLVAATQMAPDYLDAHYYLALVLDQLGDYQAALGAVKQVLTFEQSHTGGLNLQKILLQKVMKKNIC